MSRSATYQQLQYAIADELGDRQDLLTALSDASGQLSSPIIEAIQSAIALWEREPFYFNSDYEQALFSTVANQEFYTSSDNAAIGTLPSIDAIHVLINNNRYTLNPRTWKYLEDISVNPAVSGQPIDWAFFGGNLRFYPIPVNVYPMTLTCYKRFSNLVNNSDSNVWTQDGYDLIKSQAKLILAQEVLHDPDLAAEMKTAIYGDARGIMGGQQTRGYLYALKAETTRRTTRSRVRPFQF